MAAGTANAAAIAARRISGRTTEKAIWPIASVSAPATMPTSSAPMTPRAAVERRQAGRQSDEERQGVRSEGEDQPAEQADPEQTEDKSDDKHGGGLRDKRCDGRAFHHHGAPVSIADGEVGRNLF
jgi:hypothetical protein